MKTDREKQGLRGAVKNVIVETARFEEQDGQFTEKPWFSQTMEFRLATPAHVTRRTITYFT